MVQFKDVYVTDHKVVHEKLNTISQEEDLDYFEYQKSLEDYNSTPEQSQ